MKNCKAKCSEVYLLIIGGSYENREAMGHSLEKCLHTFNQQHGRQGCKN